MFDMDKVTSCVQRTLHLADPGTAILVWPEGTVSTIEPSHALDPQPLLPDVPDPVAKFIVGSADFEDEEIRHELESGLARDDRRRPVYTHESTRPAYR
jgi:hypothetical protein